MSKPTPYQAFGKLLIEGIKQTALARRESLQQTHQYLADELGYAVTTLYVWRRGEHIPDNPETVADLARIFAKTWGADQRWVNDFLAKGEYGPAQAVEALNRELFGRQPLTPQARAGRGIPTQPTPARENQPTLPGHRLMVAFLNFLTILFFKILETAPDGLTGGLLDRLQGKAGQEMPQEITLFPATCGDKGIDLAEQRLLVSAAFGTYFAGLLERDHSYIHLKGQIEAQPRPQQTGLDSLQRLYWTLQYPRGPRLVMIAAEGGMGKSTLAAKLVRCLFEENGVDMILGDSAKARQVDPLSGAATDLTPGYYDPTSFFQQLYTQLGLPGEAEPANRRVAVRHIRDRLEGRRAVIFVDNLETVSQGMELLKILRQLATRDVRIIVTTRTVSGLEQQADYLLVHLKPLTRVEHAYRFLHWHIQTHAAEHPDLNRLRPDIEDDSRLQTLIERTGGIPLLMQLVLSDVTRFSWQHLEHLPHLFGAELLDFLYRQRWDELEQLGPPGHRARHLLHFVRAEQYRGQTITFDRLKQWAAETGQVSLLPPALALLQERFLIINHNVDRGNFAMFPSLAEFLSHQNGDTDDG